MLIDDKVEPQQVEPEALETHEEIDVIENANVRADESLSKEPVYESTTAARHRELKAKARSPR